MPVSVTDSPSVGGRVVHRSDSNRSDRSDASAISAYSSEGGSSSKKVSFNKAVRVKKYKTPPISPIDIPENKFWFKVYKTQPYKSDTSASCGTQFDEPEEHFDESSSNTRPLSTIVESNADSVVDSVADSDSLVSSPEMSRRMPANYESSTANSRQRMVRSSNNAVQRPKYNRDYSDERDMSPPTRTSARVDRIRSNVPKEPEIDYLKAKARSGSPQRATTGTAESTAASPAVPKQSRRNPIVNGVKVMFGMSPSVPKKGKTAKVETSRPSKQLLQESPQQSMRASHSNGSHHNQRNEQRNDSPNRSKTKLDLYSAPSRNANLTSRKLLHNNCDNELTSKAKSVDNAKYSALSSKSNNGRHKNEEWSDAGNETLPLDEVINNAKLDLVARTDSDDETTTSVHVIPVEVWRSGPQLMSDKVDFQKSLSEMPGEGKVFSSREEGTKVWQNKTRKKYHEYSLKPHKESRKTDLKAIENIENDRNAAHKTKATTDDEKIVTANDLDDMFLKSAPTMKEIEYENNNPYIYSYIPTVRDVGIQCNRKKTTKHLTGKSSSESSYRIIKSTNDGLVTAYSDVPLLRSQSPTQRTPTSKLEIWDENKSLPHNEVIYSQVDKTKKKAYPNKPYYEDKNNNRLEDYRMKSPASERRSPNAYNRPQSGLRYQDSELTPNTNKTIVKNTTKGFGFKFSTGVDGPDVKLPKSPPLKSMTRSVTTTYTEPEEWTEGYQKDGRRREVTEEVLEETISISNASSDDIMQHNQNTDIDEFLAPKSVIKELDHKRKEISYVNVSPKQRQLTSGDAYEGATVNGGGLWYRDIDEDYRRGMAQNEVSHPNPNEPTYYTLSRVHNDSHQRDYSPPPRHAYTLDRKHLKERKKRMEELSGVRDEETKRLLSDRPNRDKLIERQYRSNADLSEPYRSAGRSADRSADRRLDRSVDRSTDRSSNRSADRSVDRNGDQRGGLAAAYKQRQEKRASSLNRMSALNEGRVSPAYSTPRSYLSHSHLNSAGNSAQSSSDSDTINKHKHKYVHDREPIVMYIPAVSHHNKKADEEEDRLSGILRRHSISSKRSNLSKKGKTSASSDITPTKPREYPTKPKSELSANKAANYDEEMDEIVELRDTKDFGKSKKNKKNGLSRRHSIPKDTKFPWLQKLKFKVRSKD